MARTITIRFTTDKNGKRRAHYWGLARRWLPISIAEAELKLATGAAVPEVEDHTPELAKSFWAHRKP